MFHDSFRYLFHIFRDSGALGFPTRQMKSLEQDGLLGIGTWGK